jgi:2-dehydro-3-deoxy-D-arabinonate dehydratase
VIAQVCRFAPRRGLLKGESALPASVGLVLPEKNRVLDLGPAGVVSLDWLLNQPDLLSRLEREAQADLPGHALDAVRLLAPVERQEVWAAGVTYLRSKAARMEESAFSASAYDRVYAADRPELFFKAPPEKVVGHGDTVGARRDSRWTVPEPELALMLSATGRIVGYTIGNDMSARDIEGDNLLYLPQAKIYERSCALGPWIVLGPEEAAVRDWTISLRIRRDGAEVFAGQTEVGRIKRGFGELADWLFRSQRFPNGAVLLTGTGIVPPDDFSLRAGDEVEIAVSGIGRLVNPVVAV